MDDLPENARQANSAKRKRVHGLSDDELHALTLERDRHPQDEIALVEDELKARHPNPLAITSPSPKPSAAGRGCLKGCLTVIAVIAVFYLFNAIFIVGGSLTNQAKWRVRGSSDYTLTASLNALSPIQGESTVVVQNGLVIAGRNALYNGNGGRGLEAYNEVTVQRMFNDAYNCAIFFPFLICSFEYDANYGYPKRVNIDCSVPGLECYRSVTVEDMRLAP